MVVQDDNYVCAALALACAAARARVDHAPAIGITLSLFGFARMRK